MDLYEIVGDFSDSSSDDEGLSRTTDFKKLYEKKYNEGVRIKDRCIFAGFEKWYEDLKGNYVFNILIIYII